MRIEQSPLLENYRLDKLCATGSASNRDLQYGSAAACVVSDEFDPSRD
jgi:hypothetical protein